MLGRFATAAFFAVLVTANSVHGREFFCPAANITCLFDAIMEANFNGEANTIFLDNGIYTGLQLPSVAGPFPLTIIGEEPENTILDASGPLSIGFFVAPEGSLTLDGLTVKRARVNGIRNLGSISIINTKIDSNSSFATGSGAGISNSGTANIANSTISNNIAFDDSGGGIANTGFMNITNSAIVSNSAGGRITNGGGIVNIGVLHIVNTTVAKNGTSGGPVRGGGIDNFSVSDAGGILKIINSTITENSGNSGAGISNNGTAELENTILAFNIALGPAPVFPPGGPDCAGSLTSLGNNLIGDATDCAIVFQGTDVTGSPGLAAYTENMSIPGSGHYPLLTDSRAIDSGSPDVCPETDQLGNPRVGICDIGSVEFQGRLLVSVDIRPKKDANRINPNSSKNINVAIFSANGFDATTVDPNTVHFGATGAEAGPVLVARSDIDGDGDPDMLLRFQIQSTGIKCGDISATLTGQTSSGLSIIGSSPIKTVQCKKPLSRS